MKKGVQKIVGSVLSTVLVMSSVPVAGVLAATDGVKLDSTNFPDATFRSYIQAYDTDSNGYLSDAEIEAVKTLKITESDKTISSTKGLEYLTSLENLSIKNCGLKALDVSANTKLVTLDCSENYIGSIDVSKNENLTVLYCSRNDIASVDVSNNPNLIMLLCTDLNLTSLDVSKNTKLQGLYCSYNNIESLDLSNNPNLHTLFCAYNSLKELDISNNPKMEKLICHYNNFKSIDITKNENLVFVSENGSKIDEAFVKENSGGKEVIGNYGLTNGDLDSVRSFGCYDKTSTTMKFTLVVDKKCELVGGPEIVEESGVAGFVERLYTVAMGRESDPSGKAYWSNEVMANGKTGADVAFSFLLSDEFLGKSMTDDQFLEILYKTFFDREGEAAGKNYWIGEMKSGAKTKTDVIYGFINSAEWANICLTYGIKSGTDVIPTIVIMPNPQVKGFAERLYTTCLKRESDEDGLAYWAYQLSNLKKTGSEAAKGFFFSEEIQKDGISDAEFLTRLYTTLMNRVPEEDGFNYWLGEMKSGKMSRGDVFDGFAGSAEWIGICSEYGILR